MGVFDRLLGRDVASLPVQPPAAPAPRHDSSASEDRLDSIYNALSGLGGAFDLGQAARPSRYVQRLDFMELENLYETNEYAKTIVDFWPKQACRKAWDVFDLANNSMPMALGDEILSVPSIVEEALIWAQLYGGSLIFPVLNESGINTPRDLLKPIDLKKISSLSALHVLDAWEFSPAQYDRDPMSTNYRKPLFWNLSTDAGTLIVHHSRVIYFHGRRTTLKKRQQNGGIDSSFLQACWNALRDKTSIDQSGAAIAQRLVMNVMKVRDLPANATGSHKNYFREKMKTIAESVSLLNMLLLGENDSFETKSTPATGFRELDDSAMARLSVASRIPRTLLFGETPGGLNTDGASQRDAVTKETSAFQTAISPSLRQLYSILLSAGGKPPAKWEIRFRPLDELTDTEQADLELKHAQTDAVRVQWGFLPAEQIARSRYGKEGYKNQLIGLEEEQISEASKAEFEAAQAEAEQAIKTDAGEMAKAIFLVPLAGEALSAWASVRRAVSEVLPDLDFSTVGADAPHITLLYVGDVLLDRLNELGEAGHEALEDGSPISGCAGPVNLFPNGTDGYPVVISVEAPGLKSVVDLLVRSCAHLISSPQFKEFRPHATIGYLKREPTAEELAKLLEIKTEFEIQIGAVDLLAGTSKLHTYPLVGGGE